MNLGETYFNTIILYYKILPLGFICKILISCEAQSIYCYLILFGLAVIYSLCILPNRIQNYAILKEFSFSS